jgi:hypothetical protein
LIEEVFEAIDTCYYDRGSMLYEAQEALDFAIRNGRLRDDIDLPNLTRELCDINVTGIGVAAVCGLQDKMADVWDIVAKANKAKAKGGYRDENGKWRKPADFVDPGPEIERVVNAKTVEHCCGLMGFNPMMGDECERCVNKRVVND